MFPFPTTDTVIPPGDQMRVRHARRGLIGWTRRISSNRDVGVQFDGESRLTWCVWSELEAAHDIEIPPFPGNVVRLPVRLRAVEYGA